MIEITRAITEPIQVGYQPRNVKKIVTNHAVNVTVTSGFFPLVAMRTTTISPIVNMRENRTPASVCVVSNEDAIASKYSLQITKLIELRKGEGGILDLTRRVHQGESHEHDERPDHHLIS